MNQSLDISGWGFLMVTPAAAVTTGTRREKKRFIPVWDANHLPSCTCSSKRP